MPDSYGLLDLPAPVQAATAVVTDPALGVLVDYFGTILTANLAAAWAVFAPNEPIVRNRYSRDPSPDDFDTKKLPALYAWRDSQTNDITGDDIAQDTSIVSILWVYPPAPQYKQAVRLAVQNGLTAALGRAIFKGRDPSWIYLDGSTVEKILNGDFHDAADWVHDGTWVLGGGIATAAASNTALSEAVLYVGGKYRVRYTVTVRTGGTIRASCGTTLGAVRNQAGTYTEDLVCAGNTTFALTGTGFSGSIDNVSVATDPEPISYLLGSSVRRCAGLCRPILCEKPFASSADLALQKTADLPPIRYPAIRFGVSICEELALAAPTGYAHAYTVEEHGGETEDFDLYTFNETTPL